MILSYKILSFNESKFGHNFKINGGHNMKIKNNLNQFKVNNIYFWSVDGMLKSIHEGTKTVKILSIENRKNYAPLAKVQSIETKEIFETDIGHLQSNPEYLKEKYHKLMHYYRKNNP